MGIITYRQLELEEAERIREIDASQYIGKAWREVNGVRKLVEINYQDPDFPNGYESHFIALKKTILNGGSALGAFDDDKLIGFCSVNANVFGAKYKYVLVDQIFIGLKYRSKGIGKQLFFYSVSEAIKFGADKFYICAGSSEETIAFYRKIGCVETMEVNEELYEGDTRDIQFEYSFVDQENHGSQRKTY